MKSQNFMPANSYSNYNQFALSNHKKEYNESLSNKKGQYYYSENDNPNSNQSFLSQFQQSTAYSPSYKSIKEYENKESPILAEKNEPYQNLVKLVGELNNLSRNKIEKNIEFINVLPEKIINKMKELFIAGEWSNLKIVNKLKCSFCKNKGITLKISCSHRICKNCFLIQVMDPSHSIKYNLDKIICLKCKNIRIKYNDALKTIISEEDIIMKCKKNEEKMNLFKCNLCNKSDISRLVTRFYSLECGDTFCLECILLFYSNFVKSSIGNPKGILTTCPINSNHLVNNFRILSQLVHPDLQEKIAIYQIEKYNLKPRIVRNCMKCCKCIILYPENELTFNCRKCNYSFCVNCFILHPNKTCKDYQIEKKFEEEKSLNKDKYEELYKLQNIRLCPHCKSLYHRISGCNHMTCKQTGNAWCFLCGAGFGKKDYSKHWSEFDYFDPACPNFPKKNCPNCKILFSRPNYNNLINCTNCKKNWCFLCQQIINNNNPIEHYNGHSKDGNTCPNMPLKKCPKCNSQQRTRQGLLIIKCDCDISWCYLCSTIITEKNLYSHFKEHGDYGIKCGYAKPKLMFLPEIPLRKKEVKKNVAKKEIKKL